MCVPDRANSAPDVQRQTPLCSVPVSFLSVVVRRCSVPVPHPASTATCERGKGLSPIDMEAGWLFEGVSAVIKVFITLSCY